MPDLLALNGQIIGGVPLPAKNYVKLWENPDPTSAFIAQDITLSSDDYDFLLVICGMLSSSTQIGVSIIAPKGKDIYLEGSMPQTASGAKIFRRLMTRSSDTSFNISEARYSQGTSAWSQDDTALIPIAIYSIKKDALATEGGGVGGGHIIEDSKGTDLDQQDILQFKGTLRATNDAQNGKTIIDDSAVEIEWDDWQAMTEAQREAYLEANPKVDILNFPDASGEIDVELFTKLWENSDPTTAFESQYIDLLSDDYDFLLCISKIYTNVGTQSSVIASKGSIFQLIFSDDGSVETRTRKFAYVSDTRLSINDAYANGKKNNNYCIPLFIYGIKKKVTVGVDAIAENASTSASKCIMPDGETTVAQAIEEIKDGEWTMLGYCNCSAQSAAATTISAPPASAKQIRLVLKDGTYDSNFWLGNSIYNLDEVAGGTMRQSYAIGSTSAMVNYQLSNNALSMNAYNYSSAVSGVVYYR